MEKANHDNHKEETLMKLLYKNVKDEKSYDIVRNSIFNCNCYTPEYHIDDKIDMITNIPQSFILAKESKFIFFHLNSI